MGIGRVGFFCDVGVSFSSPIVERYFSLEYLPFSAPSREVRLVGISVRPRGVLARATSNFNGEILASEVVRPRSGFITVIRKGTDLSFSGHRGRRLGYVCGCPSRRAMPKRGVVRLISKLNSVTGLATFRATRTISGEVNRMFECGDNMAGVGAATRRTLRLKYNIYRSCTRVFLSTTELSNIPTECITNVRGKANRART